MEQVLDFQEQQEVNYQYAGFWIRFAASIIDALVLLPVNMFVSYVFFEGIFAEPQSLSASLTENAILFVISFFYSAFMESSTLQATVGKMALGIKVINGDGKQLSFMNAAGRDLAKIISSITLLIGYIMAAWHEKHQALHDKMANTYVVYKQAAVFYS